MATNTLGTGVLILKANATQLEQGLDKAAAKTKSFDKQTASAGSGFANMFKAAAVAAMAVKAINSVARATQELAKEQRETLKLITDANSAQEARALGLLSGSDEDIAKLQQVDRQIEGIEQTWKEAKAAIGKAGLGLLEEAGAAFGFKIPEVDRAAQEEWKKKQREAKAEQEALTKSIKDMDTELTKQAATIGKTAGEVKLYDLAIKGVDVSRFRARMLANDIRTFEYELRKSIATLGMTAEQVKRFELAQRGANAQTLAMIDRLLAQREAMERVNESMSLVVSDPISDFQDKLSRLNELFDRGRITWEAYGRSVEKVADEFWSLKKAADAAAERPAGVPQLREGTRETAEFIINARNAVRGAGTTAQLDELKKQAAIQAAIRDNGKALIDLWKSSPPLKVEKVDLQ